MYILAIGLNHKTAPVEIREIFSVVSQDLPQAFRFLHDKPHIEGCAILSTCNRTEIYAAVTDVEAGYLELKDFLTESCKLPLYEFRDHLYTYVLYDAVRHLFRVAAGLDSMILGETQVLGQVREAYEYARDNGGTNGILNTLFQQAITVGKKVRTETLIDQNPVSISYAAIEMVKGVFPKAEKKRVLLIGAGEISELTLKHVITSNFSKVYVANRSLERSKKLSGKYHCQAVPWESLFETMKQMDIVISCTAASGYLVKRNDIQKIIQEVPGKRLLIIDIAVPRDVEPQVALEDGITLFDIDDLENIVNKNLESRKQVAVQAEKIVEEEVEKFLKWLSSLFVVPTIGALKQKAENIKEAEKEKAFKRLSNAGDKEKKIIGSMANSIVNQLLHDPIINLKKYAVTHQGHLYSKILQNLFSLEVKENNSTRVFLTPHDININGSKK